MHWPFAVLLAIALVLPPFFQNWEIVFLPFPWGDCGHVRRVGSAALSPPVTVDAVGRRPGRPAVGRFR